MTQCMMVNASITIRKALSTIERNYMLVPGDRVGVAVSGGADSVALLHILRIATEKMNLELFALHLNHGIRGEESDRDQFFVKDLSESMGIPFESEMISIPDMLRERGGSLEDVCRDERYAFFERIRRKRGLNKIALGHTLNDQAETIIMRFLRGSGLEGLKGFLPVREGLYIRPLMDLSRGEIISFLEDKKSDFITDSSNNDVTYLRNRIRKRLIPDLRKSYNSRLEENIGHTAEILRLEDDFIGQSVAGIISEWRINKDNARIDLDRLKSLHPALLWRLVKVILEGHSRMKNGIGYLHVKAVVDLIYARGPSLSVNLPFNLTARREYDALIIGSDICSNDCPDFSYKVSIPGSVDIAETGKIMKLDWAGLAEAEPCSDNTVFMDYNSIICPLMVRNLRPGDRIQPLGMEGTKKVARLMIDEKVPKMKRRLLPMLADNSSVLWVPGLRLSDRVKVTNVTEKVVKAQVF